MKKSIVSLFVGCILMSHLSYASTQVNQPLFDKPEITRKYQMAIERQFQIKNQLSCYAYLKFSVTELDEGEKGAADISVRYKSAGTTINELCRQDFKGKKISLDRNRIDGYFDGAVNQYIFVRGTEPFGALMALRIYDAFSGKKIFETEFNYSKGYAIKNESNKISLTYDIPLKFNCVVSQEDQTCWKKILKQNNISEQVKISPPDCREPIKRLQQSIKDYNSHNKDKPLKPDYYYDEPDRSFQITVKARIDDITQPNITYLGGSATCFLTP